MSRRRWFARDHVASTGWCCLIVLAIGGCCGVLAADSAAMELSGAVARAEEGGCYRPLSDVIWGFLVTLFAFSISLCSWKYTEFIHFILGVCAPYLDLARTVENLHEYVSLLWNCHKMEYSNSRITSYSWLKLLCSSLFPWSKSPARILASCHIVVYVSKESPLLQKTWLWSSECAVTDESEAMVVGENGGRAIRNDRYERKELGYKGVGLLVWKNIFFKEEGRGEGLKRLPKYDELKYLRANSGFGVFAIVVQAFGYVYAVRFRAANNLAISPLEVIGFVFNIILLMKVLLFGTYSCRRPLVIYMDGEWQHEVGEFNDNDQEKFKFVPSTISKVLCHGIMFVIGALIGYFLFYLANATYGTGRGPIILFYVGNILSSIPISFTVVVECNTVIVGFLFNVVAYIWAIVLTVLHWRTMHFNTRGDLINISQIIPFIG